MCLGIPGKVVEVYERDGLPMAKVQFGGIFKEACLAYTPEVQVGQYVLVHVGFALSQIDESEAREIFTYLEEIEKAEEGSGFRVQQQGTGFRVQGSDSGANLEEEEGFAAQASDPSADSEQQILNPEP